jgi:hypothetical protein
MSQEKHVSSLSSASDFVLVRDRQWIYLGPIFAAPFAHIAVSLYRNAKTIRQKQLIVGFGIVGSTSATIGMRLYLMYHAGLPGIEMDESTGRERTHFVPRDEKTKIENPTASKILAEAVRGLG